MQGPAHLSFGECGGPPIRHSGLLNDMKSPRGSRRKLCACASGITFRLTLAKYIRRIVTGTFVVCAVRDVRDEDMVSMSLLQGLIRYSGLIESV